jgi:hypothetical protein
MGYFVEANDLLDMVRQCFQRGDELENVQYG